MIQLILCRGKAAILKNKPGGKLWSDFWIFRIFYKFKEFYKKTPCATFFYGFYAVV